MRLCEEDCRLTAKAAENVFQVCIFLHDCYSERMSFFEVDYRLTARAGQNILTDIVCMNEFLCGKL